MKYGRHVNMAMLAMMYIPNIKALGGIVIAVLQFACLKPATIAHHDFYANQYR